MTTHRNPAPVDETTEDVDPRETATRPAGADRHSQEGRYSAAAPAEPDASEPLRPAAAPPDGGGDTGGAFPPLRRAADHAATGPTWVAPREREDTANASAAGAEGEPRLRPARHGDVLDGDAAATPGGRPAFRYAVPTAGTSRPHSDSEAGPFARPDSVTDTPVPESQGRHAAPVRPTVQVPPAEEEPSETEAVSQAGGSSVDPDDPEDLAGWVGSLTEAVADDDSIAGRRSASGPAHGTASEPEEALSEHAAVPPAEEQEADQRLDGAPSWTPAEPVEEEEEEEYRPTSYETWRPMPETTRAELIARLDALATLVEIGRDHFAPDLIERARHLLGHAGARLRLSADHTVVALAGGTGSGKSSLFNALCGLDLSRVGITRPTTSSAHACVWGDEGAGGLLDWLGVPPRHRHSRVSELDKGDSELSGLILLDLPDHDSVRAVHTAEADRLIGAVDLLVWVLDPQKYADAAVHHRYLAEMADHGAVTVAVLNQVDRVADDEVEELLTDLRRLLETESGVHPRILTASTVTGHGIRDLRDLLVRTVSDRRASIDRLAADLDQVTRDFQRYLADGEAPRMPDEIRRTLVADLARAGGVSAVADATDTVYERRGSRLVGWPVTRWARRLRRDPLRAVRLDFLRDGLPEGPAGPLGAQHAEIDSALVAAADQAAAGLPEPWPKRMREAARANAAQLSDDLGGAVAGAVPDPKDTPGWWTAVRALQYALAALAGMGLVWLVELVVSSALGGLTGMAVLDDPVFIGFAAALSAATLLVGWLTGVGCRNLVGVAAGRRREEVEEKATERVREIAVQRVVTPLEHELAEYRRFAEAFKAAAGR
ncbi:GTPases [Marinactinospora thermotolerans DSM 45154]|uniref:GTPases n=1 Tax=Marinactinospora thermotolerans DSM 45154 TaxID=1122192 RepID=A0A1T4T8Y2_9ACTN|nr:GTPase [Marinactinospora thermotolerans]SKA36823.1 GTPases [Marinactinospora thermotolerans DSM 45154]